MRTLRVQGRVLGDSELEVIRLLRQEHPEWSRFELSVALAQRWQWRNEAGRLKDMAARSLLLKLEGRGLIDLPPPRRRNRRPCAQAPPRLLQGELLAGGADRIEQSLASLRPVRLEIASSVGLRRRVTQLLQQYHYLGYGGAVGENVQYLARDAQGRELAVMVFGAAAWKVAVRDEFVGWSALQRAERLGWITNQQRFLILPWVRVPHLASHLLSLAVRRLSGDWNQRYGHRVWLIETFVEEERFEATSYRSAGWIRLGSTTGRTRQDRHHSMQSPTKAVWVRALHPRFRERLGAS